jgi:spermidine synthase
MREEINPSRLEIKEYHGKDFGLFFEPTSILYDKKSNYQRITVIETESVGKVLLIDGLVMFSEIDEYFYHEMIVHPAMVSHPNPKKILVIGGGDGGTVRELLKYPVEEIYLVEIDPEVIDVSKKFFPKISEALSSKKVKIINTDGADFLRKTKEFFDIIISDSSDPIGPSLSLFTEEFIDTVISHLPKSGVYISQSGSPVFQREHFKKFFNIVKRKFPISKVYLAPVITYPGTIWSFTVGSMETDISELKRTPPEGLKFYNSEIHHFAFCLPNFVKEIIE